MASYTGPLPLPRKPSFVQTRQLPRGHARYCTRQPPTWACPAISTSVTRVLQTGGEKLVKPAPPTTRLTRNPDELRTSPKLPVTTADEPCAHVGTQHTTPVRKAHEAVCRVIQRNVTLIRSCSRPGSVQCRNSLTLAILDKNVTMTKTARANFTIRTGLALPLERNMRPKTHRNNELPSPNPSTQLSQTAAHQRSASEYTSPFSR